MRRRAQTDHGAAAIEIVIEVLHLLLREVLKTQKDHREIRRIQGLHPRHVRVAGHDLTRGRVDIEQHGALEAVMLRENPRERRQRFLRAILVIAGEEDDVLAVSWASGSLVNHGLSRSDCAEHQHSQDHFTRFSRITGSFWLILGEMCGILVEL